MLSAADAAAANPDGIKTLLTNGSSTFPIKSNPVFSNGPKNLPKNPSDCMILDNCIFGKFILAEELFAKALRSFEANNNLIITNNNLCKNHFRH